MTGTVDLLTEKSGAVLYVTFNRPAARNAMTWEMYQGLHDACELADSDPAIRVMVLRGAGGEAFVAGTDIAQFRDFDGAKGVEYENRLSATLDRLASVNVPVVAAVEGFCIGGGLGIAAVADVRICTPSARFGVPIARTLGNCLSLRSLAALTDLLGRSRTADIMLTSRMLMPSEALDCGFVTEISEDMDTALARLTDRITHNAPLSMWAAKEGLRRLHEGSAREDADIVSTVYGSRDFAVGVQAFLAKKKPEWSGR